MHITYYYTTKLSANPAPKVSTGLNALLDRSEWNDDEVIYVGGVSSEVVSRNKKLAP